MAVIAFFLVLVLFYENPFQRWWLWPGKDVAWNETTLTAQQKTTLNNVLTELKADTSTNIGGTGSGVSAVSCVDDSRASQVRDALSRAGITAVIRRVAPIRNVEIRAKASARTEGQSSRVTYYGSYWRSNGD
jgi:hypothetical protein